ncbi:hypothetical protein HBZC1_17850 [Helicobacter bizzozeronii CIII-1]|uniref:Uncharacterized protein n=1 Tax=Helicobacter bizzozeronii (strain CIII-1) TaxID=1002804 RepID=F8KPP0_HELBC|nr:hypothetical protein HBZC1_17850 [Helicobacter bizzozeronii CIII-1]
MSGSFTMKKHGKNSVRLFYLKISVWGLKFVLKRKREKSKK